MAVAMLSHFSHVQLCATLWTVALQAPLSMGFSRQAYWSGLPRPAPGDLPNPGIEPTSLMSPALAGRFFTTSAIWEALVCMYLFKLVCLFSLGKYPEVKSLNHMAILLLIFQGAFILFSMVTASVYIPTSSA